MTLTFPELYDAMRAGEIRVKRTDTGVRMLRGIGRQFIPGELEEAFRAHYDDLVAMMHDEALRATMDLLRDKFDAVFVGFTQTLEERNVIDHRDLTEGTPRGRVFQAGPRHA